jgi:hypothetical protein
MRGKREVNRKKGCHYGQTKGFYVNRTSGGDRYYCAIDGNIDAGPESREKTGTVGFVSGETETMGSYIQAIY